MIIMSIRNSEQHNIFTINKPEEHFWITYHAVQEGVLVFQDVLLCPLTDQIAFRTDRSITRLIMHICLMHCGLPCDAGCQAVGSGADASRVQGLFRHGSGGSDMDRTSAKNNLQLAIPFSRELC
jgi:hypothetical protein